MPTSKIQRELKNRIEIEFPALQILENTRPDWLITESGERLELDIFVPSVWFAVEVQGEQHFREIEFFHKDQDSFAKQVKRDQLKLEICTEAGLVLLYAIDNQDFDRVISRLSELALGRQLITNEQLSGVVRAYVDNRINLKKARKLYSRQRPGKIRNAIKKTLANREKRLARMREWIRVWSGLEIDPKLKCCQLEKLKEEIDARLTA